VGGRIGGLPARPYIAAAWTTADAQPAHLREQVISLGEQVSSVALAESARAWREGRPYIMAPARFSATAPSGHVLEVEVG
jgi:hypothetical protein